MDNITFTTFFVMAESGSHSRQGAADNGQNGSKHDVGMCGARLVR